MPILARYDDGEDQLVPAAHGNAGWRYDPTSSEEQAEILALISLVKSLRPQEFQ